jgi:hypothetical protein
LKETKTFSWRKVEHAAVTPPFEGNILVKRTSTGASVEVVLSSALTLHWAFKCSIPYSPNILHIRYGQPSILLTGKTKSYREVT